MFGRKMLWIALAMIATLPMSRRAAAESFTTRIEPRPFYGAVVTLEEGVRVIRPLPPERQVIINPNGTPLSLGFNDTRVYEQRKIYNYSEGQGASGVAGEPIYTSPYFGSGYGRGWGRGNGRGHGGGGVNHRPQGAPVGPR